MAFTRKLVPFPHQFNCHVFLSPSQAQRRSKRMSASTLWWHEYPSLPSPDAPVNRSRIARAVVSSWCIAVDASIPSPYQGLLQLVVDGNDTFSAVLVKAELQPRSSQYVHLQLVNHGRAFYLWVRCGDLDGDGAHVGRLVGEYTSRSAGIRDFRALFRTLTGGSWSYRSHVRHTVDRYATFGRRVVL